MIVDKKGARVENLLIKECRSRAAREIVYREMKAQTLYVGSYNISYLGLWGSMSFQKLKKK